MRVRGSRQWRSDEGSTLIEFSLAAFMFVIVLLGVVEMGRMVLVYTTVANSARAGARYAIVHGFDRSGSGATGPSGPGSVTQVQTVVKNFASAGIIDGTKLTVTVTYPSGDNKAGSLVNVTATYPYDPFVRYFNTILGVTLGSTSQGVIVF